MMFTCQKDSAGADLTAMSAAAAISNRETNYPWAREPPCPGKLRLEDSPRNVAGASASAILTASGRHDLRESDSLFGLY